MLVKVNKRDVKGLSNLQQYQFGDEYVGDKEGNVYRIKSDNRDHYMCIKMSPFYTRDGYVEYVLTDVFGRKKHINAHRVVAGLFLDGDPDRFFVNHKDGVRSNNNLANLEYVTRSENMLHSYRVIRRSNK